MSIGHMTDISHVMFGISGVFAAVAAVMFFALDIAKCWRMVSGHRIIRRDKQRGMERKAPADRKQSEETEYIPACRAGGSERTAEEAGQATEKLLTEELAYPSAGETVLLDRMQERETGLELIQDIVYMQDTKSYQNITFLKKE